MRVKESRSKNTTPNPVVVVPPVSAASAAPPPPPPPSARLPPIEAIDTDYLEIRVEQFRNLSVDDIVDQPGLPVTLIPDSRSIDALVVRLQRLQETLERRNIFFDRGMRMLAQSRKNRIVDEDHGLLAKKDGADDKRARLKKRKADKLVAGDNILGMYTCVCVCVCVFVP